MSKDMVLARPQVNNLPIADRVLQAVRAKFADWDHHPGPENWCGLEAIARTLQAMADGEAANLTYLSSEPPGIGKTTVIIEFLVQFAADPKYRHVGAVIFLNTLDAIETLVTELLKRGVPKDRIAIEIGKDDANDNLRMLGRGEFRTIARGDNKGKVVWKSDHENAQILICTQQKLLSIVRAGRRDFEKFWRCLPADGPAEPRRVRIWDEAILPAESVVITPPELEECLTRLRTRGQTAAAQTIEDWLRGLSDGDVDEMPTELLLETLVCKDLDELYEEGSATEKLLHNYLGATVRARKDYDGLTLLHYRELLPENFAPLLVTDASGSLRLLYEAWKHGRGGLERLPSGTKTYRNLTIHHWDSRAGKQDHNRSAARRRLAQAAVSVLKLVPAGDQVLFVVRKRTKPSQDMQLDIIRAAKAAGHSVDEIERRMRFVTWGKHMGTNQFHTIKHVVLVGVLQTRMSVTEADLRAAGKLDPITDLAPKTIRNSRLAEAAHNIYQAAGRGAVRKMYRGDCPAGCSIWAIFSSAGPMDLPQWLLRWCFPKAEIEDWEPFGVQLRDARHRTDNRQRFIDALVDLLGAADEVSFERKQLTAFDDTMALRYLKCPRVKRYLLKTCGIELTQALSEGRRRGNPWMIYTLRRVQEPARLTSTS